MRRLGAALGLSGAALLMVSLFFDWYAYEASETTYFNTDANSEFFIFTTTGLSAWEVFELADIVLLLCAVAAVMAIAAPRRVPARTLTGAGILAVLVVAVELANTPPVLQTAEDFDLSVTREVGAWLGVGGALAMLAGAVLRRNRLCLEPGR